MKRRPRLLVYRHADAEWRWRLWDGNRLVVGPESFDTKSKAKANARGLVRTVLTLADKAWFDQLPDYGIEVENE